MNVVCGGYWLRKLKPEEFSSEIKIGDVKLNPVLLQNL